MGGKKRENGGQKVGQRLWWGFDGFGYKGDVGLGRCRGILVWRVGWVCGACKGPWLCMGVQRGHGLEQGGK